MSQKDWLQMPIFGELPANSWPSEPLLRAVFLRVIVSVDQVVRVHSVYRFLAVES